MPDVNKQDQLNALLNFSRTWIRMNSNQDPTFWDVIKLADCLSILPPPPVGFNDWLSNRAAFLTQVEQLVGEANQPSEDEIKKTNASFIKSPENPNFKRKSPVQPVVQPVTPSQVIPPSTQ